ncbi:hypothetical protein QL285_047434 [Trifolium repens]|nr:hypothetical protein QL285_047434 [Trifolium repens]
MENRTVLVVMLMEEIMGFWVVSPPSIANMKELNALVKAVITSKVFLDKVSTCLIALFTNKASVNEVSALFCEDFAKRNMSH